MSLQENNEKIETSVSSTTNVHSSEHKNTNLTSTTNRISPPLHLTINQFQPVFKEAKKKKQQHNTKTNDKTKNLDQTLFKGQHDDNTSDPVRSEQECTEFKDENHFDCSSSYTDKLTKFNRVNENQSNTFFKSKESSVVDEQTDNYFRDTKRSDIVQDDEGQISNSRAKLQLVAAQSRTDLNKIQCFVFSPSPTCNLESLHEVFNLNQSVDNNNILSENNSTEHKETIVRFNETTETNVKQGKLVCTTSILNDDFTNDISNELCPGYSPSRQPLINSKTSKQDEENGLPNISKSISASSSRVSTWTANGTRRLSMLGQALIKSSSIVKTGTNTGYASSSEKRSLSYRRGIRAGLTHTPRKVQFDKTEEEVSHIKFEENSPER